MDKQNENFNLPMRYNAEERALIKNTFFDEVLMAIRKFILQGDLNEQEQEIIKDFSKKTQAVNLLKNALIPELNPSAPIDNLNDMFVIDPTLSVEYSIFDLRARQLAREYFTGRLNALTGKLNKQGINLKELSYKPDKEKEQAYVDLKARNEYIIKHMEFQIKQLQYFAKLSEETEVQEKERAKKDSAE